MEQLNPGPDEQLLEIGCGPGVAVALICERLAGGRIVAIDRSATAISRATQRNAEHIAAGKAVLLTMALEELRPSDVLEGVEGFDKIFAMNVNLFWVRSPASELDLVRRLLGPGGALYLFYGYGEPPSRRKVGENAARVPEPLAGHLTESGFAVEVQQGPGVVCVVAGPELAEGGPTV